MKRKKILKIIGLILLFLVIAIVTVTILYHIPKEYEVTVKKIDLDYDNIYNYLVETELQSGESKEFVIDNPGLKKTEISKRVYSLDEGKKYSFKVIGWEIPIINQHERIIDFENVS